MTLSAEGKKRRKEGSELTTKVKLKKKKTKDVQVGTRAEAHKPKPSFGSGALSSKASLDECQKLRLHASTEEELSQVEADLRAVRSSPNVPIHFRQTASERLALQLAQSGRWKEAREIMKQLGFKYSLSRQVLAYNRLKEPALGSALMRRHVRVIDNVLSQDALRRLQRGFAESSPFWPEHRYGVTGYFSYLHRREVWDAKYSCADGSRGAQTNKKRRTAKGQDPTAFFHCVIQAVHDAARERFPAVEEASAAEWWAHCRPHASGHQLHFDSDDEGAGGVRNPIVSCVLYLEAGQHPQGEQRACPAGAGEARDPDASTTGESEEESAPVGGPTLVTTQRLVGKELAKKGWLVYPKVNRLCIFDGGVLHGVIPGRGATPVKDGRRITLMIAFWKEINTKPPPDADFGACMPFPSEDSSGGKMTWPALLMDRNWDEGEVPGGAILGGSSSEGEATKVTKVWDDVDAAANAKQGLSVEQIQGVPHIELCFMP